MGSHDDALSPSLSTKVREEGEEITLGIYSRRASVPPPSRASKARHAATRFVCPTHRLTTAMMIVCARHLVVSAPVALASLPSDLLINGCNADERDGKSATVDGRND